MESNQEMNVRRMRIMLCETRRQCKQIQQPKNLEILCAIEKKEMYQFM